MYFFPIPRSCLSSFQYILSLGRILLYFRIFTTTCTRVCCKGITQLACEKVVAWGGGGGKSNICIRDKLHTLVIRLNILLWTFKMRCTRVLLVFFFFFEMTDDLNVFFLAERSAYSYCGYAKCHQCSWWSGK